MSSKERTTNRRLATGYLTKAAYNRFKTPPWYLQSKKGNSEHDT